MSFRLIKKLFFWTEHVQARRPRRHSAHLWLRRKIAAVILLFILLGCSSYFWYFSTDERIRLQTTKALQQIIGGEIVIEHASLEVLRQIRIQELKVYLPQQEQTEENLVFYAKDVILRHTPWSVLGRQLYIQEIVAYKPKLSIWYDHDQKLFNTELLRSIRGEKIGKKTPRIILEQGSVSFHEIIRGQKIRYAEQRLRGKIEPKGDDSGNLAFIFLRCSGDNIGKPLLEGTYNPRTRKLSTTGNFQLREMIEFTNLPERVVQWREQHELEPEGSVTTDIYYDPNMGHIVHMRLSGGKLKLPVPLQETDLPLHDVKAELRFTNDRIDIETIEGKYREVCNFSAQGVIGGYRSDAPFNLTIQTEDLRIPPGQWSQLKNTEPNLPDYDSKEFLSRLGAPLGPLLSPASPDIRRIIHTFSPTGALDLELSIQRPVRGQKEIYHGILDCKNIQALYQKFPYPLQNVEGKIHIKPDQVVIGPLTAQHDEQRVEIQGLWTSNSKDSTLNITVSTEHTPLDENLYAALNPWQQQLWDEFVPAGKVNSLYHVTYQHKEKTKEQLDITLNNVSMRYRGFPVPLTDISGWIKYAGDLVCFQVDTAQAQSGQIRMEGFATQLRRDRPALYCALDFQDISLDQEFSAYLPAATKVFYQQIALQGRAEGTAELESPASTETTSASRPSGPKNRTNEPLQYKIHADLHEGKIQFEQLPYLLDTVEANVELGNEKLQVNRLEGRHGKSFVQISGELKDPNHYYLQVHGKPIELTQELALALGNETNQLYKHLNPSGQIELTMDLKSKSNEEEPEPNKPLIIIEPTNCQIKPKSFPYLFHIDEGKIEVFADKFLLTKLTNTNGEPNVELSGIIPRTVSEPNCHLNITADSVALDGKLGQALPDNLAKLYKKLEPSGKISLALAVNHPMHTAEPASWDLEGQISLAQGGIRWPIPMENIQATLIYPPKAKPEELALTPEEKNLTGYDPKTQNFHIAGELSAPSLYVKKRLVQDLQGKLKYQSLQKSLTLTEMSGYFCDGQMAGEIMVQVPEEPLNYELKLQFTDADLKTLLEVDQPKQNKWENLSGALTGWLNVRKSGDPSQRNGTFLFIIRDAVLGELPIAAQILHVLNLSLPKAGAFNEASLAGDIVGEKVRFDPIHLHGSAVALTGAGIMTDPNHHLELVFMVDSPHKLPKIPVITSFLNALKGEIAQVWVTGTFYEPKVEPVAFPSLEEALRQLDTDLPPPVPKHRPTMR